MEGAAELARLRARIAELEKRPYGTGPEDAGVSVTPAGENPLARIAGRGGLFQEVFADELRQGGAALGFALGLARLAVQPSRPAVVYLQLAADAQELGFPYAPGFAGFGFAPQQLILGRIETLTELLWALEEAVACRAVAAVVADIAGIHEKLDFTVSRRLSLRTAASGTSAILVRYGTGREAGAAQLRWKAAAASSGEVAFDPFAPGAPRFSIVLEKSRLGAAARRLEGREFLVDWVDNGFVVAAPGRAGRPAVRRQAPASGAEPAALGNRLPQAG